MRHVEGEGRPEADELVLEGGPADGTTMTIGFGGAPYAVQIQDSYRPTDPLNGYLDEYVETDIRDRAGRKVYVHRRQRYTAEGGTWRPVG